MKTFKIDIPLPLLMVWLEVQTGFEFTVLFYFLVLIGWSWISYFGFLLKRGYTFVGV
jgi:hypothetical protein